jgi:hypothetical protein
MPIEIHAQMSGTISIADMRLTSISVKYSSKIIYGNFYCDHNRLPHLNNSPKFVRGYFDCFKNFLFCLDGISLLFREIEQFL